VRYGEAIGTFSQARGHNGTIMGSSTEMLYLPATFVINAPASTRTTP
jgi:hypothetical protein